MLTIGVVDEGVGIFPTLYKLKQVISANFVGMIVDLPLGKQSKGKLCQYAQGYLSLLQSRGCDGVVFSSIDLSSASFKFLQSQTDYPLFGCEAPILHASTYTISNVLVVGDKFALKSLRAPNLLPCVMEHFPTLAEEGNQRKIVEYVAQVTAQFDGRFDCIALAHSSMNMYKSCFSRVYPNVQIFDSVEGVARRVRKKFKKQPKEESAFTFVDTSFKDISSRYQCFLP